jgi:hypothetical protein
MTLKELQDAKGLDAGDVSLERRGNLVKGDDYNPLFPIGNIGEQLGIRAIWEPTVAGAARGATQQAATLVKPGMGRIIFNRLARYPSSQAARNLQKKIIDAEATGGLGSISFTPEEIAILNPIVRSIAEEEPEKKAEGGVVEDATDYTKYNDRILRALIKRYGSEEKARQVMRDTDAGELLKIMREEESASKYTPAEELLLKRYSTGGPASRPTLPGDRSTGYKQEGDEENRLKRFLEAAATELPSAIKRGVTSNSDLAAKYLKFKFGMMSPDEAMMVARSLPETLKGAAVAAMQAVKEAPRAVAEATPESAGQFTAQMVAGELTDPTRLGRVAGTLTKPTISAMGDVVDFNKVKKQKSIDEWAEKLTQSIGNQIPMRPEGEIARNILKFKDQNKLNQTLEYMYNPESDEATFNLLMRELKKELPPDAYQMIVEGSFWNKTADEFKKNLFKLASESSKP